MSHPNNRDVFYTFILKVLEYFSKKQIKHGFQKKCIEEWEQDMDVPKPQQLRKILQILEKQKHWKLLSEFEDMKDTWLPNVSDRFFSFYQPDKKKKPKNLEEYLD